MHGVVPARVDAQEQRDALLGQPAVGVEHRRDDLGERENAAERADRVAGEAARIARSVEPLVVLDDGANDVLRVLGEAIDEHRRRQRMNVYRAQLVAAQPLFGVEQARSDVQHAEVVQQSGGGGLANVDLGAAAFANQVGAQQGHQDAVVEQRRSRLACERQVQGDGTGEPDRCDRVEQRLARGALGSDAREERPANGRRACRRLERSSLDAGARVDALVER